MKPVVYDASVLIAADRSDRRTWALHRVRLEAGVAPCVPSPVVAQVSRDPRQVQLRRLLRGCHVEVLSESRAHAVGSLLAKSKTRDVVDAAVVVAAIEHQAEIQISDHVDIRRLISAAGFDVPQVIVKS
jgi:hypothetical protein